MKSAILLVTAMCLCSVASAQDADGNLLLKHCNVAIRFVDAPTSVTSQEAESGMYCMGLVRGIVDTVMLWQESDKAFKNRVSPGRPCLTTEIKTSQAVRIVVKYLNDHPEQLHHDDSLLVVVALKTAFPCH
jgi:Rap1a immunity proteins